jgi:hypothetical protein
VVKKLEVPQDNNMPMDVPTDNHYHVLDACDMEDDEDESKETGVVLQAGDTDSIVLGEAQFSRPPTVARSLEQDPRAFVDQTLAAGEVEEDISGNQELQLQLLKRLPISQKSWSEVVQVMADEYRRTRK